MDLRVYYQKIREVEGTIPEEFPMVVSLETPDGGKPGTTTEVPRKLAAKMIVEGQARLAKPAEANAHREALAEARRVTEQAAAAMRLHVSVLSTSELEQLKADARKHTKG
jgi:hypothetical protein